MTAVEAAGALAPPRLVLVVEDEALTRSLIVEMLESAGFEVQACASAVEALRECRYVDPDAVITDIDLGPGPSGLDLVENLGRTSPHIAVLILSNYPILRQHPVNARKRLAYLDKREVGSSATVIQALEAVLRDEVEKRRVADDADAAVARLSRAQLDALRMMAEGLSNAEIAAQRGISKRAAESLIQRTIATLGISPDERLNPRVQAVRIYFQYTGVPR
jgi:DNA-binding NarL/FixJ family response regulator